MFQRNQRAFPARAGMNRYIGHLIPSPYGVPRTRGDEPAADGTYYGVAPRSPHARG